MMLFSNSWVHGYGQARFAYGNVLTWKHLVENGRYRETPNG